MSNTKLPSDVNPELDWIKLKNEIDQPYLNDVESTGEKMTRKIKENPMVPIGCLATASALTYGLWCFRQGKTQMSQYMMRARIAAQGFTVVALIIGIGITANKAVVANSEENSKPST